MVLIWIHPCHLGSGPKVLGGEKDEYVLPSLCFLLPDTSTFLSSKALLPTRPFAVSAQANGVMFRSLLVSRRKLPEIHQIDYQNKLSKELERLENFKI